MLLRSLLDRCRLPTWERHPIDPQQARQLGASSAPGPTQRPRSILPAIGPVRPGDPDGM